MSASDGTRTGISQTVWIALGIAASAILVMLVQCLDDPHGVVAGDAHYVFVSARSLAYDGDLDLTNQYVVMGDRWGLGRDPTRDGWRLPAREIGASLLMVPGLWLHRLLRLGPSAEPACACLLSAASLGLCWFACVRVARSVSRGVRAEHISATAAVFAFVVPYYACVRTGYNHAPDAAIGACICWQLCERGRPAVLGTLLACAVLIRMQNLLWLLWPGLVWLSERSRSTSNEDAGDHTGGGSGRGLMLIALLSFMGLIPQLWLGLAHPGSVRGSIGWTLGFFDGVDYGRDLVRVFVGAHGLLTWTPIALLALLALIAVSRDRPGRIGALTIIGALALLFASVHDVDGGTAFGARRFAGCVGIVALGLAHLHTSARERASNVAARVLEALLLVALVANLWRSYEAATGTLSLTVPVEARKSLPSQR